MKDDVDPAFVLVGILKRLLNCCELNMDDMEDETREVIGEAETALNQISPGWNEY